MGTESIRQSYRPERVRLLLVGESPPASGDFFYTGGNMTTFTAKAFGCATGQSYQSTAEFLNAFKRSGCYLDDLCHKPINKHSTRERKRAHRASVESLASRLKQLDPDAIAIVMKGIVTPVRAAIGEAGLSCPVHVLPFPGNGHQNAYMELLAPLIREYVGM